MTYKAKLKVHYDTEWTSNGYGVYDDETLPEEHYTFEIPVEDINSIQLFRFFATIARTMGHCDQNIMRGACSLAFNDMRSEQDMKKIAEEYELKLSEDYAKEFRKLEDEIYELKQKLAKIEQLDEQTNSNETLEW